MKKTFFNLFAILCIFSSCVNTMLDEPDELGVKDLVFNAMPYTQTPMSRTELSDACKKLSLALYTKDKDGNYTLYKEVKQESTNSNFGVLRVEDIQYGTYTLVVVGYNTEYDVVMDVPTAVSFNNSLLDTFLYKEELKVDSSTNSNQEIQIKRVVGQFKMVMTDAIPNDVAKFYIEIENTAVVLNAITGLGTSQEKRTINMSVPANYKGESNKSLSVYILPLEKQLSEEDSNITIKVQALDSNANVLYEVIHTKVPITIGYKTEYTGEFFNFYNHDYTITATVAWDGTIEGNY